MTDTVAARPIYQAIVDEAVAATGAACGWLLGRQSTGLVVLAVAGPTDPAVPIGSTVAVVGARGFALSADQPTALVPAPSDLSNAGVGGFPGVPPSLVVAPGPDGGAILEVADKTTGGAFTFEDIELLSAFANIAGPAVQEHSEGSAAVAAPAQLAAELAALAEIDVRRYREVAQVLEALLATQR